MVEINMFDSSLGIAGFVQWLGEITDGWFWIFMLLLIFLIVFIPSVIRWGTDWPLFSTSFGCMILAIPIYFMKGFGVGTQADVVMFIFVLIWIVSFIKIAFFKSY